MSLTKRASTGTMPAGLSSTGLLMKADYVVGRWRRIRYFYLMVIICHYIDKAMVSITMGVHASGDGITLGQSVIEE